MRSRHATPAGEPAAYDAVVLAGGAARRLGGADKPGLSVGGRPLVDRVLGACADAAATVVVGPRRPTARPVAWARESPPGGGPLAALDAGLRQLCGSAAAEVVVVLSADLPFLDGRTVAALRGALGAERDGGTDAAPDGAAPDGAAPDGAAADGAVSGSTGAASTDARAASTGTDAAPDGAASAGTGAASAGTGAASAGTGTASAGTGTTSTDTAATYGAKGPASSPEPPASYDGVLLRDTEGRDQPLVAAYRTEPLRRELALLAAEHGGLDGLPMRLLTHGLALLRLVPGAGDDHDVAADAAFDCDTWDDLAAARVRIREHGHVLDEWLTAVKDELGIELDIDTRVLLDLARDAAHGVARPAAPLTTFLVGYAAARAGGGPDAVAEASRKAAALAARWAAEAEEAAEGAGKEADG